MRLNTVCVSDANPLLSVKFLLFRINLKSSAYIQKDLL